MILTIKNADFSSANIGTLNTYIVSKSISNGTTFDIPNFVNKNSSVTWTITLNIGYTFGTYLVTMGGETITPSIVDNVMTISIPEVTGHIKIVVTTTGAGAPDYPEITWKDGYYVAAETGGVAEDGEVVMPTNGTNWIASDFIDVSYYKKLRYTGTIPAAALKYVHCIYGYDANKTPVKPILTPTSDNNTFTNYVFEVDDSRIQYIAVCGHIATQVPSIEFC